MYSKAIAPIVVPPVVEVGYAIPALTMELQDQEKHKDELPKVTCNICFKGFASTKNLISHKRTTHDEYKISCIDCEKEITSSQGLLHHRQKVHSMEMSADSCHKYSEERNHFWK